MSKIKPDKLTPSIEKKITRDWAKWFPGMGIYKKRWLMRRVGPLLIGICLDRDSHGDQYKPCFHVHFLGKEFPSGEAHRDNQVVSLTLCSQLLTRRTQAPDSVKVRWHEERYHDAVERMKEQALLPLEGDVRLDQVLQAYQEYHRRAPMGKPSLSADVILMSDIIMLLAWCGRRDEAEQALNEVLTTVTVESGYRHPYGSREAFEAAMREAIDHPESIREQVEKQIERLGVGELPLSELLCDSQTRASNN